jgi:hypothetical protein
LKGKRGLLLGLLSLYYISFGERKVFGVKTPQKCNIRKKRTGTCSGKQCVSLLPLFCLVFYSLWNLVIDLTVISYSPKIFIYTTGWFFQTENSKGV